MFQQNHGVELNAVNETEMSGGEAFMAYVSRNDDSDDESIPGLMHRVDESDSDDDSILSTVYVDYTFCTNDSDSEREDNETPGSSPESFHTAFTEELSNLNDMRVFNNTPVIDYTPLEDITSDYNLAINSEPELPLRVHQDITNADVIQHFNNHNVIRKYLF